MSDLIEAFAEAVIPKTIPPIAQWAIENRVLQTGESPRPGKYDPNVTPYLAELYEIMHPDHPCQEVIVQKGTQLAFSLLAHNVIGHRIDTDPTAIMLALPTLNIAKRISKQRIKPLIEKTPCLAAKINANSRDSENAWDYKGFPGGQLMIVGANSAASMSASNCALQIQDENSRFPSEIKGEGSPDDILKARLDAYGDAKKLLCISSPTETGYCAIEDKLLLTDYRKWFMPCPHCKKEQFFDFENFVIPKNKKGIYIFKNAHFKCINKKCGKKIEEVKHKTKMLEAGIWVPTQKKFISEIKRGYHINSFYSPLGFLSWREIAQGWTEAQGIPKKLRVFYNTRLAKTFKTQGKLINHKALKTQILDWGKELPEDVCLITAGVDTQDNRLECEIVAWTDKEDSYSLDYFVIAGDPALPMTWEKLDLKLFYGLNNNRRKWKHKLGIELPCFATCIDMGGHKTQAVLNYCNSRQSLNVFAIMGVGGQGKPIWPRKISYSKKTNSNFYRIGVDSGKETIHARLKVTEHGKGACWFPPDRDEEYFRQLTSEELIEEPTKSGTPKLKWQIRVGYNRNEVFDCRNYAFAAVEALKFNGLVLTEAYHQVIQRSAKLK